LRLFTGNEIKIRLGLENEISDALERYYGGDNGSVGKVIEDTEEKLTGYSEPGEDIEHLRDMASEVPVIRLVNSMVSRAVERRASDIHMEPFEKEFRIRYRIDGILHNVEFPPVQLKPAIISRVKLMAKLNIAERRLPQDGRIKLKVMGKEIDLRVSTLPTLYGESVVMRILDKSDASVFDLQRLGFPKHMLSRLKN
jgi:general secretion pathway protein E